MDAPFLDLASPGFSTRSSEVYAARAASWWARTPYGLAVLRHREAGQLLRDRRLRQGSYAWPEINGLTGSFAGFWTRSVISQEGPTHKALRTHAVKALSNDFVLSLEPQFDAVAEALVDALAECDRAEFMGAFSMPFAGRAICIVNGLPQARWAEVAEDASALGLAMGVDCKSHEPVFNAACDRLMGLADELIVRARAGRDPGGCVARLVDSFDADPSVDEQALRDMIVIAIFGGVDTTRAQLGFAMALFAEHPDQWRALRADPSLIPNAIEEVIRTRPTTTWSTREAIETFEFGGVTIQAGQTVHLLVHASGRDPAACATTAFDVTARRKVHFGFGGGAHTCLGQFVARTDMAAALRALAKRLKFLGFAAPPDVLPDSGNTSFVRLPLQFEWAL